jgi:DNA-binding transcriptional LysR family regulator
MDIQALETFIKTAELLHFGKASRACNLSPSALTRTIQRMEEEVGHPLFLRDNRSVALTDHGERLLAYALSAVQEWQLFQESIASIDDKVTGTLSIFASITAVYSLLPELLEACRSAYPDVQLALRTGAAETAIDQVLSGEIDLAVAALPDQKPARLEFMPLAETPLVFIAQQPPKHLDFSQVPMAEATGCRPAYFHRGFGKRGVDCDGAAGCGYRYCSAAGTGAQSASRRSPGPGQCSGAGAVRGGALCRQAQPEAPRRTGHVAAG